MQFHHLKSRFPCHDGVCGTPHGFDQEDSGVPAREAHKPPKRPPSKGEEVTTMLQRLRNEQGQTMAEYGVVLAVITALVFGALALLSGNIITALTRVAGLLGVGNG
jgi:Flp pilus assembly pilin Flp